MKYHLYKTLIFSILLLATSSCEKLEITNNQRLLVKGRIVDQNGNALPNITIKTEAVNRILAKTRSDANGNFEFTSLNANNDPLHVLANIASNFDFQNENPDFASKVFTSEGANQSVLLDLGSVILNDLGSFSLYLKNLSGDENSVEYTLSYTSKVCRLSLNGNLNESCELNQRENGFANPTSESRTLNLESILGSIAIFEYSLNGGPTQTIEIPVTNPPTNYVFEY